MRYTVTLDHVPDAVRLRKVGRAVVHEEGRAEHERAADSPRPHHPPYVGVPEEDIAWLNIEAVGHVLRALDGKATVDVLRALWLARGARRVDYHVKLLGVGAHALAFGRLVAHE